MAERARSETARTAEQLARALVRIESGPSPSAGERRAALALERWAKARPWRPRVVRRALRGDRHRRFCVLLLLPGRGDSDVLFTGHLDTVGSHDFGPLRPWACDPRGLERRRPLGARWLQGRGSLDMKSGLASAAAALDSLARVPFEERRGTVALLATVDEENTSAGIRACAGWPELTRRRWRAVLSAEVTAPPPPGFRGRVHFGTVGKCLVGAVLRVHAGHAAEPRSGPDASRWGAELIREFTARRAPAGPPPTVLRARDLKAVYDTQLPEEFAVFFNVLGDPLDPAEVLRRLDASARRAWRAAGGRRLAANAVRASGAGERRARPGQDPWDAALESARAVARPAPGATLFFSPPYYESRPADGGEAGVRAALRRVARRERLHPGGAFPFISDLSFLGSAGDPAARAWRRACPMRAPLPGLGLDAVLATVGPWGRGLHRPDEAVRKDFAFGRLPGIFEACVREIWEAS